MARRLDLKDLQEEYMAALEAGDDVALQKIVLHLQGE